MTNACLIFFINIWFSIISSNELHFLFPNILNIVRPIIETIINKL
jgi:hypothetical protein